MRTFPLCWVCPGGGIEKNETVNIFYDFHRIIHRSI
jgi:hypothetical protein